MSKTPQKLPRDYAELLIEVKERIRAAQYEALKTVNKQLVSLYWDIGKMIGERQAKAEWGKAVVEHLAKDLQSEFPGIKGFSASNLWRMKNFYETYASSEKLAPLVREKAYFIDLLLFHRRLKCLVAIDLKVGEFQPEFVGKMQFYLAALDDRVREPGENPSIGIILCKEKNRTIVEYALRDTNKPIGVATYRIVKRLPKELKGQLPSPEEIAKLLEMV